MVLDIDLFRAEKGGNPDIIRESQRKRFKDVTLVDRVIQSDQQWRRDRFTMDNLNRLKNVCSKAVGEKMKKKEPIGNSEAIPDSITDDLENMTSDCLKDLQISQIKKLRVLVDQKMKEAEEDMKRQETERHQALIQIGNILDDSVPVSDDEENNRVEKVYGDVTTRKKYSHSCKARPISPIRTPKSMSVKNNSATINVGWLDD
ncbi:hypothetical protein AB6A40_010219 [Gnathostoma spinigerum]|uniref:Serine-tRNA synthetase type1 N-terminal domain-containing protein n=1 Tax=Gnathostoma spinigerum TaxID=75299 RepID=A0ABD6EU63_9BILA